MDIRQHMAEIGTEANVIARYICAGLELRRKLHPHEKEASFALALADALMTQIMMAPPDGRLEVLNAMLGYIEKGVKAMCENKELLEKIDGRHEAPTAS